MAKYLLKLEEGQGEKFLEREYEIRPEELVAATIAASICRAKDIPEELGADEVFFDISYDEFCYQRGKKRWSRRQSYIVVGLIWKKFGAQIVSNLLNSNVISEIIDRETEIFSEIAEKELNWDKKQPIPEEVLGKICSNTIDLASCRWFQKLQQGEKEVK